jgi:hypothetical protein
MRGPRPGQSRTRPACRYKGAISWRAYEIRDSHGGDDHRRGGGDPDSRSPPSPLLLSGGYRTSLHILRNDARTRLCRASGLVRSLGSEPGMVRHPAGLRFDAVNKREDDLGGGNPSSSRHTPPLVTGCCRGMRFLECPAGPRSNTQGGIGWHDKGLNSNLKLRPLGCHDRVAICQVLPHRSSTMQRRSP